jgi:hypothetical protein
VSVELFDPARQGSACFASEDLPVRVLDFGSRRDFLVNAFGSGTLRMLDC